MLKFSKLTKEEKDRVEANPNFKNYLQGLWKGRPETPASWWYEGRSDQWAWDTALAIAKRANKGQKYETYFNQVEQKNYEKAGAQGEVPSLRTKEAQEVLEPLYVPLEADNEEALSKFFGQTKQFAEYLFGKQNLYSKRRKGFNAVIDDMTDRDTLSSNSGDGRFVKRKTVVQEEIEDAKSGIWRKRSATLLYRKYHNKLRPVWMFPMSRNLIEYQFSQVIQAALRNSPTKEVREHVTPWEGYDDVKRCLTHQWKFAYGKHWKANGGDTTKMDAHTRKAHGRLFFEIVKHLFQKQEWDDLYEAIMQIFTIDLFTGPNSKLVGAHGLASGSGWTQLLETVLILYLIWLNKLYPSMGIGDDFEVFGDLTPEKIVEMLAQFLYPANEQKQSSDYDVLDFLQRVNGREFYSAEDPKVLGAYYSLVRATNSIKRPEKFHNPKQWNSNMFCNKVYMVAENCIDDPGFPEWIKWVVQGQKDLIAFAKLPANKLNKIQKEGNLIPGLNPSYNQEKRSKPLSSFYSIKFVRENC